MRCAAFESSCVSENDVTAWIAVVVKTKPTSGISKRGLPPVGRIRSIRNFVEKGSTSPATRLMPIRKKPNSRSHRRGRTSFQISGITFFRFAFFFGKSAPARARAPLLPRSAFIGMDVAGRIKRSERGNYVAVCVLLALMNDRTQRST